MVTCFGREHTLSNATMDHTNAYPFDYYVSIYDGYTLSNQKQLLCVVNLKVALIVKFQCYITYVHL